MNNISAKELGEFEPIYNKLLVKFKLEQKSLDILPILFDAVLGKIDSYAMANLLSENLGIDLVIASNFSFKIKKEILDKKKQLELIKQGIQEQKEVGFNPDVLGKELLEKVNFKITDDIIKKRYDNAILSWLKDVRKDADLRDVLIRSAKVGGVGMDEITYNKLQEILAAKKEQIKNEQVNVLEIVRAYEGKQDISDQSLEEAEIDVPSKVKGPASNLLVTQDVQIDQLLQEKGIEFAELAEKERIKRQLGDTERVPEVSDLAEEIIEEEEFLESKKEIEAPEVVPAPLPPPPPPPAPTPQFSLPKPLEPIKKIEPVAPKIPAAPYIRRQETESRPKMEDIKMEGANKLYGPIEELSALTIMDFRRLSKDPKEAVLKIIGKLELLEDESLVKKMQGIKALRSSPLYKTYAGIMNQAMIAGKSIEQVIDENKIMIMPEYQAIMELNQTLKY